METNKIPTLFPHNHASNIIILSNGDKMCVWFGGSREGKADISVQCSRMKIDDDFWQEPVILSGDMERSEQNPILFEVEPGKLWLIYTAQIGVHQDTAVVRWRKSEDFGLSWSPIENLFEESGIFVRNPPIRIANGDVLLPAYYCHKSETGFLGDDNSVMKISKDGGKKWLEYDIPSSQGLVHMSVVESDNGQVIGFFRSRLADYVYRTLSTDGGKTWKKPEKLQIPNNNASIQCTRLMDGRLAMVYNDINKEMAPPKIDRPPWFDKKDMDDVGVKKVEKPSAVWGVRRNPLVVAFSEDEGITWIDKKVLITDVGFEAEPEFSYPSIKEDSEGMIHVTFTYLRKHICHMLI